MHFRTVILGITPVVCMSRSIAESYVVNQNVVRWQPLCLMCLSFAVCVVGSMPGLQAGTIGFSIQLNFGSGFTAGQMAAFNAAKSTWQGYITGYRDTVINSVLTIQANSVAKDGVGGLLGSAGPRSAKFGLEHNYLYARSGLMEFDTADLASLEADGTLTSLIVHEMGHVLGLGTLWSSSALGYKGYQELYVAGTGQYTGADALAAWRSEFSQPNATFVPVEMAGGAGTANAHWNEVDGGAGPTGYISNLTGQDFRDELMTGWLNGPAFISTVTLGGLSDLGYTLNTSASNFGTANNSAAVPEPSTLILSTLAALAACCSRQRRPAV